MKKALDIDPGIKGYSLPILSTQEVLRADGDNSIIYFLPASTSTSMYIILIMVRTVIVDYKDELLHIQAAGCHGSGNLEDKDEELLSD